MAALIALLPGAGSPALAKAAPAKMAVADGKLTIAAPHGFCVDAEASHETGDGAFVLFGSCASLAKSTLAARPKAPAILTAYVSDGAPPGDEFAASFQPMARFLTSEAGRKALSRAGKARTVVIRQIVADRDVLYIRATDSAALEGQDVEPEYWRALFALKGQIVTLSVLGLADKPLSGADKRALLDQFVRKVRAENRG